MQETIEWVDANIEPQITASYLVVVESGGKRFVDKGCYWVAGSVQGWTTWGLSPLESMGRKLVAWAQLPKGPTIYPS